jgi:hypothetical protein
MSLHSGPWARYSPNVALMPRLLLNPDSAGRYLDLGDFALRCAIVRCCNTISERTKMALAAHKARGARSGIPRTSGSGRGRMLADEYARNLLPLLHALQREGAITIGAIARCLNERTIPTQRGSRWHVSSVSNLLARAQTLEALSLVTLL